MEEERVYELPTIEDMRDFEKICERTRRLECISNIILLAMLIVSIVGVICICSM